MSVALTPDEARPLIDQYVEGMLDDATAAAVEAAIAQDEALRGEVEAMRGALGVLHALPAPTAPDDMVARVRRQLAAEKAEALSAAEAAQQRSEQAASHHVAPVVALAPQRARWLEWGVGLAAAAALVVGVTLSGQGASNDGVSAAGVGAATQSQSSLVVTGVSAERVWALAADHGMSSDTPDGLVFTGAGDDAARFHLALLREAAARGGSVEGLAGSGDLVELRISLRPAP